MFRALRYALSGPSARKIHSSTVSRKSVVTEATDKVRQGLASAVEAGEKVTQSVKESMSSMGEQAKSKANEAAKDAKETTNKLADDANQIKRDAAGPSGILLVRKCLESYSNATLVLYVRSPRKLPRDIVENPAVVVIEGQLDDIDAVARALQGVEVVLSALGPTGPIYPSDTPLGRGYSSIISVMQQQQVQRLICLGTASIRDPSDRPSFKFGLIISGVRTLAYNAYKDMVAIGDAVRSTDLDWTIVRVPFLTSGACVDVVAGYVGDGEDSAFLSRAGFAGFVVSEIGKREWIRKAPLVSLRAGKTNFYD
ncbi:hypothetical protein APHAL10511_006164 [Amanita phalloides]|nr:hypothetical protein APHAL10511_006164 [Amanita phalloides]